MSEVPTYKYRGEVKKCKYCSNPETPVGCKFCLSRGFVAVCLNCNGTGSVAETAVWDGKSKMTNACNICNSTGLLPCDGPATNPAPADAAQEPASTEPVAEAVAESGEAA